MRRDYLHRPAIVIKVEILHWCWSNSWIRLCSRRSISQHFDITDVDTFANCWTLISQTKIFLRRCKPMNKYWIICYRLRSELDKHNCDLVSAVCSISCNFAFQFPRRCQKTCLSEARLPNFNGEKKGMTWKYMQDYVMTGFE